MNEGKSCGGRAVVVGAGVVEEKGLRQAGVVSQSASGFKDQVAQEMQTADYVLGFWLLAGVAVLVLPGEIGRRSRPAWSQSLGNKCST